jgi:type VI protein secretion system component Hcp
MDDRRIGTSASNQQSRDGRHSVEGRPSLCETLGRRHINRMERVMTTNNIDCELSPSNELRDEVLDQVTGGVIITKHVDKASPALFQTGGGNPGLEYWLQQLMF